MAASGLNILWGSLCNLMICWCNSKREKYSLSDYSTAHLPQRPLCDNYSENKTLRSAHTERVDRERWFCKRTSLCPRLWETTWNYQNRCHQVYIAELMDFIDGKYSSVLTCHDSRCSSNRFVIWYNDHLGFFVVCFCLFTILSRLGKNLIFFWGN